MVLRQPRTSCNNGRPIHRISPVQNLQDNRCFECQVGTPPNTHHATCLHRNDLAPTPNRFSILAGLNPSPETKWPFDFVPTAKTGTRRRGKRGGRQQRLKHGSKKKCEKLEAKSVDELCDRFEALHLDDDDLEAISQRTDRAQPSGVLSGVETVRHHWAPQFRPNSLPTPNSTLTQPAEKLVKSLSQNSTLDQGFSADVRPTTRKPSPKFPLSAFLKDIASPNDCPGYWPPRNPTSDLAVPPRTIQNPNQQPARLLLTSDRIAGGCSPDDRSSNIGSSESTAIKSQRTAPTTSSLSTNAVSTYKRFPACEASPKPISGPNPRAPHSPTLTLSLPPPIMSSSPYPRLFRVPTSAMLSTTAPASQKSYRSWQETSEDRTVFCSSPKSLITAPVMCPYFFVYPPQPWTPSAVPSDLFKHTAAVPTRLKSKFTFTPDPPSRHVKQEEFLAMGHDPECWCDRYKKARPARDFADEAGASGRTLTYGSSESLCSWGHRRAAEPQSAPTVRESSPPLRTFGTGLTAEAIIAELSPEVSLASSLLVTPGSTHAPQTATKLEDHDESASSDEDVVMITPTSDGTDFGFQRLPTPSSEIAYMDFDGLEVLEGIPVDSEDDWPDDDWTSIAGRLFSQQLGLPLVSRTVSDTSSQSPDASAIVSLPPFTLLSPPRTPTARAQHAHVSYIGSESETD